MGWLGAAVALGALAGTALLGSKKNKASSSGKTAVPISGAFDVGEFKSQEEYDAWMEWAKQYLESLDEKDWYSAAAQYLIDTLGKSELETPEGQALAEVFNQMWKLAQPVKSLSVGPYNVYPGARLKKQAGQLSAMNVPAGLLQQYLDREMRRKAMAAQLAQELAQGETQAEIQKAGLIEQLGSSAGQQIYGLTAAAIPGSYDYYAKMAGQPSTLQQVLGAAPGAVEAGEAIEDIVSNLKLWI